eukprot:2391420-Alexandrium_andersonii.AAC.1
MHPQPTPAHQLQAPSPAKTKTTAPKKSKSSAAGITQAAGVSVRLPASAACVATWRQSASP